MTTLLIITINTSVIHTAIIVVNRQNIIFFLSSLVPFIHSRKMLVVLITNTSHISENKFHKNVKRHHCV